MFGKLAENHDEVTIAVKMKIYDKMALERFLFSIPEKLLRAVQIKEPHTLEQALKYAMQQANFDAYYYENRPISHLPQNRSFKPRNPEPNTRFYHYGANNYTGSRTNNPNYYRTTQPGQSNTSFRPNQNNGQVIPNQNYQNRPAFVPRNRPQNSFRPNYTPRNNPSNNPNYNNPSPMYKNNSRSNVNNHNVLPRNDSPNSMNYHTIHNHQLRTASNFHEDRLPSTSQNFQVEASESQKK